MKVWLLTTMPYPYRQWEIPFPLPGYMFDRRLGKDLYEGYLALYRRADELGFDGICVAEHHSGKTGIDPSPNLMASVLAKQTNHARIVVMGNCLPLHGHPIRLAEELAMVDILSDGRLTSGFIRGNAREYASYSVDASKARGMFEEAWKLIVRAWTDNEPFSWHGEYYQYDFVSILPRPLQQPHPQIVTAASTAESIEWAAKQHVSMMTGFSTTAQLAETTAYYRKYAEEQCGWVPQPENIGVSRHTYVSTTNAKAREECERHVLDYYRETATQQEREMLRTIQQAKSTGRSFSYKTQTHIGHPRGDNVTYERLLRDGFCIIGDPDTVTQKVKEQQEALGAGILVTYLPFGSMEPEEAIKSIELFAKEVMPNLR
jgi:alkanesulfonate monooxygenase SsuD/methylene tetrahydromethanopterin reductase-like flavin-dependent oxidoreductase (luciferase family)